MVIGTLKWKQLQWNGNRYKLSEQAKRFGIFASGMLTPVMQTPQNKFLDEPYIFHRAKEVLMLINTSVPILF